jgi:predicted small lipoprotein YifL
MRYLLTLILLTTLLAACGQKGGLYIPQENSLQGLPGSADVGINP